VRFSGRPNLAPRLEADRRLHSPDRVADAGIIEAGKADSKSSAAILLPGKAAAGQELQSMLRRVLLEPVVMFDEDNVARFAAWRLNMAQNLAFIVEVKTGRIGPEIKGWRPERLRAALLRLGMFEGELVPEIAEELEHASAIDVGSWSIVKLLVTKRPFREGYWLNLTLADADAFIANRVAVYKADKLADRLRFPDDLMQYLAWKS